ncbi:Lrp/AsnC ligand binding domain-containing protein [Gymnodinialimonas sp. 2305UL16-5]
MNNMIEAIQETPQIVACDRVSGEDCFVPHCRQANLSAFGAY